MLLTHVYHSHQHVSGSCPCKRPEALPRESAEKSASGSAGPKGGAEESSNKKVLRVPSSCATSTEVRYPKHIFRHFPWHPVSAVTLPSLS